MSDGTVPVSEESDASSDTPIIGGTFDIPVEDDKPYEIYGGWLGSTIGYLNAQRNVICGRCEPDTGNSNQGHYWAWCKVTRSMREFHFCCPDNCALERR